VQPLIENQERFISEFLLLNLQEIQKGEKEKKKLKEWNLI
jgi:hypothetical protein